MKVKVAIDAGPLTSGHSVRGIGFMVREEINAIKKLHYKEITIDTFDFSKNREKLIGERYDIVHLTSFFPFAETLPSQKLGKKMIVTIPDLTQLIYSKNYPPGVRGKLNFIKQKQRLKNVDAIITISETSKKDIVRFLGVPAEEIHVVYLAAGEHFKPILDKKVLKKVTEKFNLPEKFVLYLGDVNYNKNIPNLIRACATIGIPLVICGKHAKEVEDEKLELNSMRGPQDWLRYVTGKSHPEIAHYSELKELFKKNKVIRLGYVSEEDLITIFSLASVYCQPSLYEGFGLPVLQAFASHCPVVISKTQALVEIAGEGAIIADPKDPKDLAAKISKVLGDKRAASDLVKKGFERSKEFSWGKTAKELIQVYKSVKDS